MKAKAKDPTPAVTAIVDKLIQAGRLGGGFILYRETAIAELVEMVRGAQERRL